MKQPTIAPGFLRSRDQASRQRPPLEAGSDVGDVDLGDGHVSSA